jgi:hypothetical protein
MKNGGFEEGAYLLPNTEIIYRRNNNEISYKGSLNVAITIPENELSLEKMSFIADKRNIVPDILASHVKADSFYMNETYHDFKMAYPLVKELSMDYLGVKYTRKKIGAITKHFIEKRMDTMSGVHLKRPEIESLGFEFWSFSGAQTYLLK